MLNYLECLENKEISYVLSSSNLQVWICMEILLKNYDQEIKKKRNLQGSFYKRAKLFLLRLILSRDKCHLVSSIHFWYQWEFWLFLLSLEFVSSLVSFHQLIISIIGLVRKQSSSSLLLSSHMHQGGWLICNTSSTSPSLDCWTCSNHSLLYVLTISNVSETILPVLLMASTSQIFVLIISCSVVFDTTDSYAWNKTDSSYLLH